MTTLGWVTGSIALLAFGFNAIFWSLSARRIRRWKKMIARRPDPARWPCAHVFVCLKGASPRLASTAAAVDGQDYPGEYRVTFITEGPAARDEAAAHLAPILPSLRRSDHVVAGRVMDSPLRCAQKNYNLLAGIRHADEEHREAEVYAFCDGDLHVQPSWLREVVRPLAIGESEASTSFHYAGSDDRHLMGALHGLAETCQSLAASVCRGFTWGGSTAILVAAFRRLDLGTVWASTVVDDLSMSRAVREARVRVTPVAQFLVRGRSEIENYGSFVRWLGRQFFFVKIYTPWYYRLLWSKMLLDVAALWLATFHVAYRVIQGDWPAEPWVAAMIVASASTLIVSFLAYRRLIPERPSVRAWFGASLLVSGASLLACADASLRRKRLTWRDKTYVLARGGRVVHVDGHDGPLDDPIPEKAVA